MHAAKGLEFRATATICCDREILPAARSLMEAADETALAEAFAVERHLLYVATTRARERLLVSGKSPISDFLQDLVEI
ncbi:3'-5' exonuclease [Amaricoccus macauensis]|uniref:3'-5' exonuclease n=1 Tax=Amaricoccus macauensis TaxID=57001 RepID=UPI003CCCCC6A